MTEQDQTNQGWTIQRILERSREIYKKEGIWSLWIRILGETVYRRAVLFDRNLDEPVPGGSSRLPVTIRRLAENETEAYIEFQPDTDMVDLRRCMQDGHYCYVAWHNGRIVYALWGVTGSAWIDYLSSTIRLAPDETYLYESYTLPDFRGQNIPASMSTHIFRKLTEEGIRRGFCVVLPENKPAMRHVEKSGWNPCGMIGYVKLGPFRHEFCRMRSNSSPPEKDSSEIGI